MEDIHAYAEAYKQLLSKGYTPEHLTSLPKVIMLPEDVMVEIISHMSYKDVMNVCSSNNEYKNMCEKHIYKDLYMKYFKDIDFLEETDDYVERMKFLKGLQKIQKDFKFKPDFSRLYRSKDLNLTSNYIYKIPSEIKLLVNLTKLDLHNNHIHILPPEIGLLINLLDINLSGNYLEKLPIEIGNLKNLKVLDVYNNNIQSLPSEIGNLKKLEYLNIGGNLFEYLSRKICDLHNLGTLNISKNNIEKLPDKIGNLKNLTTLIMDHNLITNVPDSFIKLTKLKKIDRDKDITLPSMNKLKIKVNFEPTEKFIKIYKK